MDKQRLQTSQKIFFTLTILFLLAGILAADARIAVINPDHDRIQKFGVLEGELWNNRYVSVPTGEIPDGCDNRFRNASCWSWQGGKPDYIGSALENGNYSVDYFNASEASALNLRQYAVVIVQSPSREAGREFNISVENDPPSFLDPALVQPAFIHNLKSYMDGGGSVILVGEAVRLMENSANASDARLNLDKTVGRKNIPNQLGKTNGRVPAYWLFVRGNPYCGIARSGQAQVMVNSNSLGLQNGLLANLTLFNGNDIPPTPTWSETIYSPQDGVSLLDERISGEGEYVLTGEICNPPVYHVTVDTVLPQVMGYTTYRGQRVYYVGSDSYHDYDLIDHQGAAHAGSYYEMKYALSDEGRQALVRLVQYVQAHPNQALQAPPANQSASEPQNTSQAAPAPSPPAQKSGWDGFIAWLKEFFNLG